MTVKIKRPAHLSIAMRGLAGSTQCKDMFFSINNKLFRKYFSAGKKIIYSLPLPKRLSTSSLMALRKLRGSAM